MTNRTAPASTINMDDARDEFARTFDRVASLVCDDHGPRDADGLWVRISEDADADSSDPHGWTADHLAAAYGALAEIVENTSSPTDLARECRWSADDLTAALEADAMNVEAVTVAGALPPAMHRAEALADDAGEVLAHMNAVGVTFAARRKVEDSEDYSFTGGFSVLALPSKLAAVSVFQTSLWRLAAVLDAEPTDATGRRYYPTTIHKGPNALMVMAEMVPGDPMSLECIGRIQDKHAAWIRPILRTGEHDVTTERVPSIRVYVTAVTGGTEGKPTRGVNVAIFGAAQAVRLDVRTRERAALEAAAYESGSVVAVEALTD